MALNLRTPLRYFGLILALLGAAEGVMAGWSAFELWRGDLSERAAFEGFILAAGASMVLGVALWRLGRAARHQLGQREAMLMVAMSWVFGGIAAGLPYYEWAQLALPGAVPNPFVNPVNCYFEAISGLTTAGSTILSDVTILPHSLLLWRSTTHWIGGLGIVLLFVAVLPGLGPSARRLVAAESSDPLSAPDSPSIKEIARVLWLVYTAITVVGIVGLAIAGLSWFDAVNHTFAAIATGGFGTENASVGFYQSLPVDVIIIVLMVLGGINFGVYHDLLRHGPRKAFSDAEFRFYLLVLGLTSTVAILGLVHHRIVTTTGVTLEPSLGHAVRYGLFNIISLHTDTGFATADFDQWPFPSKAALLLGMFIGGSSGSTTGGIKAVRLLLLIKIMYAQLERVVAPKVVRVVQVGKSVIDERTQLRILSHVLLFIAALFAGTVALRWLEPAGRINITTAATASLATLTTAGPGLGGVGPAENFGWFTDGSTLVMCFLMVLGRLELFALLAVLTPGFWRRQ